MSGPAPKTTLKRPPQAVTLSLGWIEEWCPKLAPEELRAYLELAAITAQASSHPIEDATSALGAAESRIAATIPTLETLGLVEALDLQGVRHYHFPHRSPTGSHLAAVVLPSIRAALQFQRRMTEQLLSFSTRDDTPEVREECFREFPELREESRLYEETRDEDSPPWRLWLELSRYLIREFETRYSALKDSHREIFMESAAQLLSHKVAVIDAVCQEAFDQRTRIFPEVGAGYIVAPADGAFFTQHPVVEALARRYDVGPAQIFVNTLELLGQRGFTIAEVDNKGCLIEVRLPSTTGLTKSEERILFLRPEERSGGADTERNRERTKRAAAKYANHLMTCGVGLLYEFVRRDKVSALDELLEAIATGVNETLELVPNRYDDDPITLEHVLEKYNDLREQAPRPRRSAPTTGSNSEHADPEHADPDR